MQSNNLQVILKLNSLEFCDKFPGTVLRPGFIYGKRKVNGVDIPLGWVGEPLKKLLAATSAFTRPLKNLPASDLFLAPPVSVDEVANAVVKAVSDNDIFGTFNIEQIVSMAKN
jgi:nucleoside-diphosphate-sugar epimerase